jgi:cell division protein FtsQ
MARKSSSTLPDEDFDAVAESRVPSRSYDDSPLDARILALNDEEESPFLRGQKRVPVRRGALPRKAAGRIKLLMLALLVLGVVALVAISLYRYGTQSWRFRVDSSDNIEVLGTRNVTRTQVLDALGADIDRNIFHISLDDQKKQLEEIPWIESATVMRLLPNRIRVKVLERVPVAFVEVKGRIALVDSHGVIMDMPPGAQSTFSFPVVVSMSENEPLSTRAARMKIYTQLVHQLDSSGASYSHDLSEVDVSDPDDVKVIVSDPQGAVLVHLGSSNYLERHQIYVNHIQEWRTQFSHVDSVSLRYDGQIIMNPDAAAARARQYVPTGDTGTAATPPLSPSRAVHAKKAKKR